MNKFDVTFAWTVTNYQDLVGQTGPVSAQYTVEATDVTTNTIDYSSSIELEIATDIDWSQLDHEELVRRIRDSIGREIEQQLTFDLMRARTADIAVVTKILNVNRYLDTGTVFNVVYHMQARDLTDPDRFASGNGEITLDIPEENPDFIPYDQLTEPQVIQWIRDTQYRHRHDPGPRYGNLDLMEYDLRVSIIEQREPPQIGTGLPWVQQRPRF